ncbi:hypothetical protein EJB05_29417, partial [Eragrostis curvula]
MAGRRPPVPTPVTSSSFPSLPTPAPSSSFPPLPASFYAAALAAAGAPDLGAAAAAQPPGAPDPAAATAKLGHLGRAGRRRAAIAMRATHGRRRAAVARPPPRCRRWGPSWTGNPGPAAAPPQVDFSPVAALPPRGLASPTPSRFTYAGLGMPPELVTATPPPPSADTALASALLAVKAEALAAQERVHVAALAWDRERTVVDALARRVAETEHYMLLSAGVGWGVVLADVAVVGVRVVALVGAMGPAEGLPPRLLLPGVLPAHPSATHGQGVSRCGRSSLQAAGVALHTSPWPCSLALLDLCPGLLPHRLASLCPGWGGGTRRRWPSPSAPCS